MTEHSSQASASDYANSTVDDGKSETVSRKARGRFKDLVFDKLVTLEQGSNTEKKNRYEQLLISMIKDQWNWILDNSADRVTDDSNAVESLRMAEAATHMAKRF